MVVSVEWNCE